MKVCPLHFLGPLDHGSDTGGVLNVGCFNYRRNAEAMRVLAQYEWADKVAEASLYSQQQSSEF